MSHTLRAAVLHASILASAAFLANPAAAADSVLTVVGHGSAVTSATEARITGTADSKGATTAEAIAASRVVGANITRALAKLGVPEKDFAITGININPQYAVGPIVPGQQRAITGYNCNTNITVVVERAENLTDILQTLAEAGVSQSEHVNYVAHDTEAAMTEARAAAVKDAFARSKILAEQTGVTLGPVVSVSDGTAVAGLLNYTEQLMSMLSAQGANRTVSATVTVSWAIKP